MTISSSVSRADYLGDGTTTAFPVPFAFFDSSELRVISRVVATGVETVLTLTTHYTVSGGGGTTGTVTAVTAPASTVQWSILRNTRRTQDVDYQANDPFPAETHERALDRVVAVVQEIERDALRSLRVAETDSTSSLTLPTQAERASRILGFDVDGNPVPVLPEAGTLAATPYAEGILSSGTAATARGVLGSAATGDALFTAATAAAARTTLGATTTGTALFTATDAAAARTALGGFTAGSASGVSTLDITFPAGFTLFRLVMWDLQTSAAAVVNLRALTAGTPDAGASDYTFVSIGTEGGAVAGTQSTTSAITLTPTLAATTPVTQLEVMISAGSASSRFVANSRFVGVSSTPAANSSTYAGYRVANGAKSGIRILPGSGTITCQYRIEGVG